MPIAPGAERRAVRRHARERAGIAQCHRQAVERQPARALELGRREPRLQRDFRDQRERGGSCGRVTVIATVRAIPAGAAVELAAERLGGFGDLRRRALGGALGEQRSR